ncbi:hypothetical protein AAFF_G00353530, partial [Aldrovandia affinis]
MSGGPTVRRQCQFVPETALSEDECKEAISLMKHSADEDIVKNKMKLTFDYRRNMILDPQQSCNILFEFPRFKDVKGLVEQDFVMMFGEGVSGKLLEKWPTAYKKKIIQECRKLPSTSELEELLLTADPPEDSTERDADFGWDSDLSSVFLLLHLIPPSAQGWRKPGKVSASQAEKHLVVFKKSGTSIQEHLDAITTSSQPYLLAVGARKNAVHQFFIVLDKNAIPCRYVNCAHNEEEQNLVAFQYRGSILYCSFKPILPGRKLLVWHGEEYAKDLGISFDYLWSNKCSAKGGVSVSSQFYYCTQCPLSYTAEVYLHKHIKKSHPDEYVRLLSA